MQNLFHKCKSFTKIACFLKEEIASKFKDLKDLIEIEAGKHQVVIRMMGKQGNPQFDADIAASGS